MLQQQSAIKLSTKQYFVRTRRQKIELALGVNLQLIDVDVSSTCHKLHVSVIEYIYQQIQEELR